MEPKPALKTAGIAIGGPSAAGVLFLLVEQLLTDGFNTPAVLAGKAAAFVLLLGWAWWTAKHPEVQTGIEYFDKE